MKSSAFGMLAVLLVSASTPAVAQSPDAVRFSGTTLGCFGEDCTPTLFSGVDYLNFTGQAFDGVTRNGALSLYLGYFSWDAFLGQTLVDSPFTLFIAFTNPTGINPDPVYHTDIAGLVIRGKLNGVQVGSSTAYVNFEPNVREYTFSGGQPNLPGEFTLTLYDTYLDANANRHVLGKITDATVTPEPISMVLMGSGLAGIAAARRRRKQQQQQD